jgi:hypothetical protein
MEVNDQDLPLPDESVKDSLLDAVYPEKKLGASRCPRLYGQIEF